VQTISNVFQQRIRHHRQTSTIWESKYGDFARGGVCALDLGKDPSRCFYDIFVVFLHPNHNSSRSKTAFVVTGASVMSTNDTGPESDRYLALIADKNNYAKSIGLIGAFLVFFILENADGTKIRISFPLLSGMVSFNSIPQLYPYGWCNLKLQ
jgi:hypothetical protein